MKIVLLSIPKMWRSTIYWKDVRSYKKAFGNCSLLEYTSNYFYSQVGIYKRKNTHNYKFLCPKVYQLLWDIDCRNLIFLRASDFVFTMKIYCWKFLFLISIAGSYYSKIFFYTLIVFWLPAWGLTVCSNL